MIGACMYILRPLRFLPIELSRNNRLCTPCKKRKDTCVTSRAAVPNGILTHGPQGNVDQPPPTHHRPQQHTKERIEELYTTRYGSIQRKTCTLHCATSPSGKYLGGMSK